MPVNVVSKFQSFGEFGVLNHMKRTATAVSSTDTLIYRLHAFDYLRLLHPEVAQHMRQTSRHLSEVDRIESKSKAEARNMAAQVHVGIGDTVICGPSLSIPIECCCLRRERCSKL
eukprot:SAG22_NODE_1519_length_4238_cov_2.188935_2_plen_115_part_00